MADIIIEGDAGGGKRVSLPVSLPDNSKSAKAKTKYTNPSTAKKVVTKEDGEAVKPKLPVEKIATARKKSFGTKVVETFTGEDVRSVGNYIRDDVIIPAIKRLFVDSVQQGVERLTYGSSTPSRDRNSRGNHTPYDRMFVSGETSRREVSAKSRRNHDFDEIVLDTRAEAELVLDRMQAYIDDYGVVMLPDLYEMVDITPSFADEKFGWSTLGDASVRQIRQGYLMLLPKPTVID